MCTASRLVLLGVPFLLAAAGVLLAAAPADESKAAPPGAKVLFDGKDLTGWTTRGGKTAEWKVEDGYMEVVPGKGDVRTAATFGDCDLHVEFWVPLMPDKKGQARGNSGVYLQGRYEIQVLDSYMNETYKDGACGALYRIIAPSKNASKPPEQWQTYDIRFRAPRVDAAGKVTEKGRVTVVHNGETVIDNGEFDHPTGGELDDKLGTPGPILLQDHGCKVRYRNLWLKPVETR
jgi:hypothetical protein